MMRSSSHSNRSVCNQCLCFPPTCWALLARRREGKKKKKEEGREGVNSGLSILLPDEASLPVMLTQSDVASYAGAVHTLRPCSKGPSVQRLN